jgi:guanylate kinase
VIRRRLETAKTELTHWREFDHLIVNDDLDRAFATLKAILAAGRAARSRNPDAGALAERMSADLTRMLESEAVSSA